MDYQLIPRPKENTARFEISFEETRALFLDFAKQDKGINFESPWFDFGKRDYKFLNGNMLWEPHFRLQINETMGSDLHRWMFSEEEVVKIFRNHLEQRGDNVPDGKVKINAFQPGAEGKVVYLVE